MCFRIFLCVAPHRPLSDHQHEEQIPPRGSSKRAREASCERPTSANSLEQPAAKKVSYSIMNILGKGKEAESSPGESKKPPQLLQQQQQQQQSVPDISAFIQQQLAGVGGMNQFMMNPFLAAAAALSGHHHQGHSQPNQMPWFNMAAVSSLYGLESKRVFHRGVLLMLLLFLGSTGFTHRKKKLRSTWHTHF